MVSAFPAELKFVNGNKTFLLFDCDQLTNVSGETSEESKEMQ